MSDIDSLLDSLMDDATGVSFVVVDGASAAGTPSPAVAARTMGVRRGVIQDTPSVDMLSGVQGTTAGGKAYSVVRVSGSDRSLCFGIVGKGGGAFCIRKNCVFGSHADFKSPFQGSDETCYFICRGGEGNTIIYSQPSVDARRVSDEVKIGWEYQQKTLGEWRLAFRAIGNSDEAGATIDEIRKEVNFLADTSNFRTPSKKRKEDTMSDKGVGSLGIIDFVGYARNLPEDLTRELEEVIAKMSSGEKGGLTRIVARLETSMVSQGAALKAVAEFSHKRFLANERDLRVVSGAVQNVQTSVGQPIELVTDFDAPTLWSATSFVADEVERVAENLKMIEIDMKPMQKSLLTVSEEVANIAKSVNTEKMMGFFKVVSEKMKEASREIIGVKAKVSLLEKALEASVKSTSGAGSVKAFRSPTMQDGMDELMDMFGSSDMAAHKAKARVEDEDRGVSYTELEGQVRTLSTQLKQLTSDVMMLKAVSEDKSVKFAGLGWRSIIDCQEWIQANFAGYRYGLIMDPLLMLDRIFGSDDAEGDSQFKVLESRVKLKIATGAEAAAIKSLHFKRPRMFHAGQESMSTDRNKSKLSKLSDQKVWKSGGEGVQFHIIKRMNLLLSTISQDINHVLSDAPKAQLLATMCLNATVTFITQLITFVDAIYEKLVIASKFTAEQGWSLTMKILDRICEDLFAPKEGVVVAMDVAEPASICAHVMWSCFRTHDVMTGYVDASFENHPAISAEYVKFLATNSGFDKVEKMDGLLKELKGQVDATSKDMKNTRSIADGAASAASSLKGTIAELNKRVGKLDNKH